MTAFPLSVFSWFVEPEKRVKIQQRDYLNHLTFLTAHFPGHPAARQRLGDDSRAARISDPTTAGVLENDCSWNYTHCPPPSALPPLPSPLPLPPLLPHRLMKYCYSAAPSRCLSDLKYSGNKHTWLKCQVCRLAVIDSWALQSARAAVFPLMTERFSLAHVTTMTPGSEIR